MTDNNEAEQQEEQQTPSPEADPVRRWTLRILVLAVILLAGYLTADRLTPVSSQARIHSLVVPIAAEVSGTVVEVAVENNQVVAAGDVLFRLNDASYRLAVAGAEANLQSARQATGASAAGVEAAEAGVASDTSCANFILARFADQAEAEACDTYLQSKGLIVRRVAGYNLPNALRITVGDEIACRQVAAAVAAFSPRRQLTAKRRTAS